MFFENSNQDVNRHCGPDLRLHRVFRGSVEGLNPQVLFDPAKEQLNPPPSLIEPGNGQGGQRKIVGQKYQVVMMFFIEVTNPSRRQRIVPRRIDSGEDDRLIGSQAGTLVHRTRVTSAELEILSRPHDEESGGQRKPVEASGMNVSAIP